MAILSSRPVTSYTESLLNVSRERQGPDGNPILQNGLPNDGGTLFVEDGLGVKSGLKLGSGLCECTDPITEEGILNVRSADRTYVKTLDFSNLVTSVTVAVTSINETVQGYYSELLRNQSSTAISVEELDLRVGTVETAMETLLLRDNQSLQNEITILKAEITALKTRVESLEN